MQFLLLTLSLLTHFLTRTQAHTRFITLFVDGINQGDGNCVRMDQDPGHTTFPINGITSTDMACGKDGELVVPQTCPVKPGGTLSFLHRMYIDGSQPGIVDESHKGPCTVYMKQVSTSPSTSSFPNTPAAAGDGWFKIYEDSYDESAQLWCTEKLIANGGLLSTSIPSDLSAGQYLVRVELLALQNAQNGDPQFYIGCAQVAVTGAGASTAGKSRRAAAPQTINIPDGYVSLDMDAMKFNIYDTPMKLPYPMYGPPMYGSGLAGTSTNISTTSVSNAAGGVSSSPMSSGNSSPSSSSYERPADSSTSNESLEPEDVEDDVDSTPSSDVDESNEDDCGDETPGRGKWKDWYGNFKGWGRSNRQFGGR